MHWRIWRGEEQAINIIDLYQEDLVSLLTSTNSCIANKKKISDYVIQNRKRLTDSTSNIATILKTMKLKI